MSDSAKYHERKIRNSSFISSSSESENVPFA